LSVVTEHSHERRLVVALEKIVGNFEQLPVNIKACAIRRCLHDTNLVVGVGNGQFAMEPPKTEPAAPPPDLKIVNPYVPLARQE
jgi:hypothetical protein